jgi:hypothetical protein
MTEGRQDSSSSPERDEQWPIIKAQPRSFFKAPLCIDMDQLQADVAFIGVPFDQVPSGGRERVSAPTPSEMLPGPTPMPIPTDGK